MKTVKDSCNCIWRYCPSHKDGTVCEGEAEGFNCGYCEKIHWSGDGVFGDGVRLCVTCGTDIINFFREDLMNFMQEVHKIVPVYAAQLESLLKDYYHDRLNQDGGWVDCIRDSRALLEFANFVMQSPEVKAPIALVENAITIATKLKELHSGFSQGDVERLVAKEAKA